jgi:2-polyprenyl-3-methyl-5-hydroxy-6-metoxy-1,4-benzoquinol methylase
MPEPPLDDLLARLERERLEADRLYNDALTAVDRAIRTPAELPELPRAEAASPAAPAGTGGALSDAWNITAAVPPSFDRTVRGRLRAFIWALVAPVFHAQAGFNASLVAHVDKSAADVERIEAVLAQTLDRARRELDALARFQSLLVQYLQTITAYVDTKDRVLGGTELRDRLALAEHRILALKRELESSGNGRTPRGEAAAGAFASGTDAPAYVGFEDRFRGGLQDIRARVEEYVPLLSRASDVLDIGCGRGELLDALRSCGVRARGVDVNAAMVEQCRSRGLDVVHADAVTGLEQQQDGSVGGLVAIQVVEHFEPAYLIRFLETAHHKMRAGAPLVLETINAACWMAFFETYLRDLTHQRPLHPDTLKYLVEASGFNQVDVRFLRPVREVDRLVHVTAAHGASGDPSQHSLIAAAVNDHANKLNARLFSSMDYVVIARG